MTCLYVTTFPGNKKLREMLEKRKEELQREIKSETRWFSSNNSEEVQRKKLIIENIENILNDFDKNFYKKI